jgi:hypothetical protein
LRQAREARKHRIVSQKLQMSQALGTLDQHPEHGEHDAAEREVAADTYDLVGSPQLAEKVQPRHFQCFLQLQITRRIVGLGLMALQLTGGA